MARKKTSFLSGLPTRFKGITAGILLSLCFSMVSGAEVTCDLNGTWPCSGSIIGLILLIFFYAIVLGFGAKTISDGSEAFLDLFPNWSSVIGALLLPVLGAVPDTMVIVFSGAKGTTAQAQAQLAIGVGTLAGSTIMLLTVTWALTAYFAKCDVNLDNEAKDETDTVGWVNPKMFTSQVITVDPETKINAQIMMVTCLSYLIVQGVAFAYLKDEEKARSIEKWFALTGFVICVVLLLAYIVYQLFVPQLVERKKAKHEKERLERLERNRALAMVHQMGLMRKKTQETTLQAEDDEPSEREVNAMAFSAASKWMNFAKEPKEAPINEETPLVITPEKESENEEGESKGEEGGEEEAPFWWSMTVALGLMLAGTAIVTIFSDPMVGVLSDFSVKTGIPAFYVSFLITPYCSNASELVSSLMMAAKKKKENTSMSISQVYGACTMNNTMGLGVFFALIFFRGLIWEYTAETLSILLVTFAVGLIGAFKTTFKIWWALVILALYPFSLFLVWMIEHFAHWA